MYLSLIPVFLQALKVLIVSGMEHKFQKGKSVRVLAVDSYSVHFLCVHVGNCPRTCRNDTSDGSDGSGSDGSGSGSGVIREGDSEGGSSHLPGLSYKLYYVNVI